MLDWIRTLPNAADKSVVGVIEGEAELVARAKMDREAFTPLYTRYLEPIYRYCYRRLGNQEAAEDATSQVFVKAVAALPGYRHGSFGGWLFTIAHNVVTDTYRRQKPEEPMAEDFDLADQAPTPEEIAVAAERRRSLRAVLARLPVDQQNAIELRLAGLTSAEIAQATGKSLGSVKMLQFRALSRLRVLLGKDGVETGAEGGCEEGHHG